MAKRTRSRRGNPKGKAYGFRGLRPAAKTKSASASESGASTPSTSTQSAPSTSTS
jgi:hypothetical protein